MLTFWTAVSLMLSGAAGHQVTCQPLTPYGLHGQGWSGVALIDQGAIVLNRRTCWGFFQPRFRVDSLVSLGHEMAHLDGIKDERRADCRGVATARVLAHRLGLRVTFKQVAAYDPRYSRCTR